MFLGFCAADRCLLLLEFGQAVKVYQKYCLGVQQSQVVWKGEAEVMPWMHLSDLWHI